jgi:hypothetical protein
MIYSEFVQRLLAEAGTTQQDTIFLSMIPTFIDGGEQRCYRDLDLLSTVYSNASSVATANNRNFTLPTAEHIVMVQGINFITPVGQTNPELGTRISLTPVTKEFLDAVYNSSAGAGVPAYFAMMTDQTILFGPWPDQTYTVEVIGTIRPKPLSSTNATTFLTLWLPDLFLAAAMISVTGYQANFGAQSDDPASAKSWDNEYTKLLQSAGMEEAKKKFASGASQSIAKT